MLKKSNRSKSANFFPIFRWENLFCFFAHHFLSEGVGWRFDKPKTISLQKMKKKQQVKKPFDNP